MSRTTSIIITTMTTSMMSTSMSTSTTMRSTSIIVIVVVTAAAVTVVVVMMVIVVFTSWGKETTHKYTEAELNAALTALGDVTHGTVLRAKGIVPCADGGEWLHFDYVPGAPEIRRGSADYTGRLCVIGSELDEERIASLFGVN